MFQIEKWDDNNYDSRCIQMRSIQWLAEDNEWYPKERIDRQQKRQKQLGKEMTKELWLQLHCV